MNITVVSSLDVFSRQKACAALAGNGPESIVVFHDLLEDGLVIRRIFREGRLLQREESRLAHGCLSCTVRLDVVPAVKRMLVEESRMVLGLPPGVPAATAVHALLRGLGDAVAVGSVVVACAPDAVEDQIWDHHTLFESGYTPVPDDERTPGEFLMGEFAFGDTVVLADPALVPVDPAARARGVQLIRELAPHAVVTESDGELRSGRHRLVQATARAVPGSVQLPAHSSSPFRTVVQRLGRPLHPERFRHALAALSEGCCWVRGRLWVASAPDCRIAIQGIGPRIWLEDTGPWRAHRNRLPAVVLDGQDAQRETNPESGDRGTVLAVTGDDVDPAEIAALLAACELTDAELAAGPGGINDPFGLDRKTESTQRSNT